MVTYRQEDINRCANGKISHEQGTSVAKCVYDLKGTLNCVTGFHEERAILLGRLGRHEQALTIYIHILKDNHLAEQ